MSNGTHCRSASCECPALCLPFSRVQPKTEAISHPPSSPLSLQSTSFTDKGLHQGTHLTAFMVPKDTFEETACGLLTFSKTRKSWKRHQTHYYCEQTFRF